MKALRMTAVLLCLHLTGYAFAEAGSGGDETYRFKEYTIHVFRQDGTFTFDGSRNVDVLLVGGGGAGGAFHGGGGGGGGVLIVPDAALSAGTYQVVVGRGGVGSSGSGTSGENSRIAAGEDILWEVRGGGGGGCKKSGLDGASGGGGGIYIGDNVVAGGKGEEGVGFSGGIGAGKPGDTNFRRWGGGGGGAGEAGGDAWYATDTDCGAGKGGDGRYCDFSGTNVCYGGGGGGGSNGRPDSIPRHKGGFGGSGGGGDGSGYETSGNTGVKGVNGVDGLGGGGGGGGSYLSDSGDGGDGGSGVVIVRYRNKFDSSFKTLAVSGGRMRRIEDECFTCVFTNNGSFTVTGNSYVDVLLVGGGGGGGAFHGGGGGGGGVVITNSMPLYAGTYNVVVGSGGAAGRANYGEGYYDAGDGGDTVVDFGYVSFTALGGGGGATPSNSNGAIRKGRDGASGGGGSVRNSGSSGVVVKVDGGDNISGQGNKGGAGYANSTGGHFWQWGGGGGGAGEAGGDAWYSNNDDCGAGDGGDGLYCDFSGMNLCYGSGGGGGSAGRRSTVTKGGANGGGDGGSSLSTGVARDGGDGVDGLGGGGGGGGSYNNNTFGKGGKGGCGTVVIRCRRSRPGVILFVR